MFFILALVLLAIIFYYYIVKPYNFWKEQGVIQGKPVWVLGDTWKSAFQLRPPSDTINELYKQFPNSRYAGIYQFLLPTLLIRDPDLYKQIAIKDFEHFMDHRNFLPGDVDPLWSNNLVVLQGKKWRDMRSILSPSFTSSKLKTMFVLIKDCAQRVIDHLSNNDQEVSKIEAKDFFTRITNDVIASTSFGVNVDSLAERDNAFYEMGKGLTTFISLKSMIIIFGTQLFENFFKVFKLQLFSHEVRTYFQDLVNKSVKIREENEINRPDIINLLVQARKMGQKQENGEPPSTKDLGKAKTAADITNEDIASQAMVFFFGGFDSTSSLMCFTAYELALNKDIQDRLRQEIFDTLKECGGEATYDGISQMKYMDMVVTECLRKWPSFVFNDRVCTKDYVIEPEIPDEKPLYIKKGCPLLLPVYGIHHDPKYYPDPERFDPERFSDKNKGKLNSNAFFSFGAGPRNCIGSRFALIETKTVFFYLLSNFELVPVEETDIPVRVSKRTFNLQPERMRLGLKRLKEQMF